MAELDVKAVLGAEDPFEYFERRAKQYSASFGYSGDFAYETLQVCKAAFGESWLLDQVNSNVRGTAIPFKPHRLGDILGYRGLAISLSYWNYQYTLNHSARSLD